MTNPSDNAELWWVDAPFGCGGVYTIGGQIISGGAPIFNRYVGQDVRQLAIKGRYTYVYLGVELFESWSRMKRVTT